MKVCELKKILEDADDDNDVSICVESPGGYVCPDGAVVGVKKAFSRGIDWHGHECLIVPEHSLRIVDVDAWAGNV